MSLTNYYYHAIHVSYGREVSCAYSFYRVSNPRFHLYSLGVLHSGVSPVSNEIPQTQGLKRCAARGLHVARERVLCGPPCFFGIKNKLTSPLFSLFYSQERSASE